MPPLSPNHFYTDFDTARWDAAPKSAEADYRTPFQIDRDRIIYTSAFRRLQAKTQVFFSGEYDFYRTRLTHSIEVAQIGRSICRFIEAQGEPLSAEFHVDSDLVEAICLGHDLGHPPFGHAGERALHELMRRDFGGFEGNAQSLRLVTATIYGDGAARKGMAPTRAFVDGILKYKTAFSAVSEADNHFVYDDQAPIVDFAFGGGTPDVAPGGPLNGFRSIECQIMDWADDTAYSLNDVLDGIRAGFITLERLERWSGASALSSTETVLLDDLRKAIRSANVEAKFGRKIGVFIRACSLRERRNFMSDATARYRYELVIDPSIAGEAAFYKQLARDLVFDSPQICQLEHKGNLVLGRIFDAFSGYYLTGKAAKFSILPPHIGRRIGAAPGMPERARLLCDYIAGMTDGFAVRTYKRLFDPEFGSIADLA